MGRQVCNSHLMSRHTPEPARQAGEKPTVSQTGTLYQLQTFDTQIDGIRKRLAEIERLLGQSETVRRAQAGLDAATASHSQWKTRLTDLELERRQLRQEADEIEQRLYSGRVHNPRELTDLQGKLVELRRRYETLEEPNIEAMLEIEAGEAAIAEAEANLERVIAKQADEFGALATERDQLAVDLSTAEAKAQDARARISTDALRQYDRLRQRPGGIAVVKVTPGGECSVCGVQLTSGMRQQVRHGEVLACPTCGRILHHP